MTTPQTALERDVLACVERLVTSCETSAAESNGLEARSTKRLLWRLSRARRRVRILCEGLRQECPEPDAVRASRDRASRGFGSCGDRQDGIGQPFPRSFGGRRMAVSVSPGRPGPARGAPCPAHSGHIGTSATQAPALAMQILDAADHAERAAEISATNVNRIALARRLRGRARRPVGPTSISGR